MANYNIFSPKAAAAAAAFAGRRIKQKFIDTLWNIIWLRCAMMMMTMMPGKHSSLPLHPDSLKHVYEVTMNYIMDERLPSAYQIYGMLTNFKVTPFLFQSVSF